MTLLNLSTPSGKPILAWKDWTQPKHQSHWKPGRSAMELARAWFRTDTPSCPEEFRALLDSNDVSHGIVLTSGRPELVTPLPERGEGRNHDLWLLGETPAGKVTICVEAKADETFGERLGRQLQVARKRQPRTRAAERARVLLGILFGKDCNPEAAPWRDLRYQLITAAAGAALQAVTDQSVAAILAIHEFRSSTTSPDKLADNQVDLDAFLATLQPGAPARSVGALIGPIALSSSSLLPGGMPLYIGKVVTELGAL